MISDLLWRLVAAVVAQPEIAALLIRWAQRTPDEHIGEYMGRWWLFNPYDRETRRARYPWCPFSIRVHHIRQPDHGRELHDHPWDARTIVLRGWYAEHRLTDRALELTERSVRGWSDTARIGYGEFHRISQVSPAGAWTLFIMGRYRGTWGFWVNGRKVPYKEHLA